MKTLTKRQGEKGNKKTHIQTAIQKGCNRETVVYNSSQKLEHFPEMMVPSLNMPFPPLQHLWCYQFYGDSSTTILGAQLALTQRRYQSTTSCYSILHWGRRKSSFMWPSALSLQIYSHSKELLACMLSPTLKAFPDAYVQKQHKQFYQCLKRKDKKAAISKSNL